MRLRNRWRSRELDRIEETKYNLIVTDLCMPNKHGHALSVELLARERVSAPVIVVHTSVDDPRMTKDLLMRGVDDVVYKPTNYAAFAAKMRALVSRRKEGHAAARSPSDLRLARGESMGPPSEHCTQPLISRNSTSV